MRKQYDNGHILTVVETEPAPDRVGLCDNVVPMAAGLNNDPGVYADFSRSDAGRWVWPLLGSNGYSAFSSGPPRPEMPIIEHAVDIKTDTATSGRKWRF